MPHAEDCSIRTRSGLEEVTGLRLSLSDTWRRDFTENPEIGQWQFLQDAIDSAPIPELGSPGPMMGGLGPGLTGFDSLEQPWGELAEIVPPVDPGVAAAADVDLVLDAVLV